MFVSSSYTLNAYNSHFKMRTFGSIGYTAGGNYNVGDGSLMNFRSGIQPLYQVSRHFGFGMDIGYIYALKAKYTNDSYFDGRTRYGKMSFLSSHVFIDLSASQHMFVTQFGAGTYMGMGDNKKIGFGFFIATGFDFPLNETFSLPALTRFEFIIVERVLIPVNVMVGITIKFGASGKG